MNCQECGAPLRQMVAVVIDCPFPQVNLNKAAIRGKDVQIVGAYWTMPTIYCTGCGYITHSPLIEAIQRDEGADFTNEEERLDLSTTPHRDTRRGDPRYNSTNHKLEI